MPFSGGMTRKLSTCSLPAALLMEQSLTPSSSCDRFSPTGSTCSLDKYSHTPSGSGGRERTLTSYHRSTQEVRTTIRHSSNSEPPPTLATVLVNGTLSSSGCKMIDTAILKTIPSSSIAKSNTNPLSRLLDPHRTSESSTTPKTGSPANSLAATPSSGLHTNGSGLSPASLPSSQAGSGCRHGGGSPSLQNSSWADTLEEEVCVSKPEWAHLPNYNGEPHSSGIGNGNRVQSHTGAGIRLHVGVTPVHVTPDPVGVVHHRHHYANTSRPSAPHAPVHGYQAHYSRNPHEGGSGHVANTSDIIIPQPLHPGTGRPQVGVANPNWNKSVRPYLHPSTMTIVQAPTQQPQRAGHHHLVHHNQNNSSANGLMRGPILPHGRAHGILMIPPGSVMGAYSGLHSVGHAHPPPPVACYNCGKRGHLGNTCPAVTMDATDTSCELCSKVYSRSGYKKTLE